MGGGKKSAGKASTMIQPFSTKSGRNFGGDWTLQNWSVPEEKVVLLSDHGPTEEGGVCRVHKKMAIVGRVSGRAK